MPVSEAQKEANKRWREKNRKRNSYISGRNSARSFIRNHATIEDIAELRNLLDEREKTQKEKEF